MGQWYCKSGIKQTKNSIKNAHNYEPPKEFIEAVINSDDPDNDDYFNRVLSLEKGYDFWLTSDRTLVE